MKYSKTNDKTNINTNIKTNNNNMNIINKHREEQLPQASALLYYYSKVLGKEGEVNMY